MWLVGDWDCVGNAVDSPNQPRVVHNHVTLGTGGEELEFASTLDATTKTVHDVLGYDAQHRQWYEHNFDSAVGPRELFGESNALDKDSLTLLGTLEVEGGKVRIRATYTWPAANAYRFEAAAWTSDKTWLTLEVHDCKRKN